MEIDRGLDGNQCTLRVSNVLTVKQFWDWDKVESVKYDGYEVTGEDIPEISCRGSFVPSFRTTSNIFKMIL